MVKSLGEHGGYYVMDGFSTDGLEILSYVDKFDPSSNWGTDYEAVTLFFNPVRRPSYREIYRA